MHNYSGEQVEIMINKKKLLEQQLKEYKAQNYHLNMARGKPCVEQVNFSNILLSIDVPEVEVGEIDYKNYGVLDGLPEAKILFAELLEVTVSEVIVGGNSSLNMMYNLCANNMLFGTSTSQQPWGKEEKIKFICPVPGYDRHFSICALLGIEMISVEMTQEGPDMDQIEKLVATDSAIKGIWCVPKYANPSGVTYSDDVVRRLAKMPTAASDFRIFWDNAYVVHDLYEATASLMPILSMCKKAGNGERPYLFTSLSKVTIPGAAVAAMATSEGNVKYILSKMQAQMIGQDKVNQYRHVRFLKNLEGIRTHMKQHATVIRPKFEQVLALFEQHLGKDEVATWSQPIGGYFIDLNVLPGCATKVVNLAKTAGVTLTPAGATYPYGKDPLDRNIRIAPTFPTLKNLKLAIEIVCVCIQLVSITKLIEEQ